MFIHHLATILLLSLSWITNLTRAGSVVLLLHDSADVILEVGGGSLITYEPHSRLLFYEFCNKLEIPAKGCQDTPGCGASL